MDSGIIVLIGVVFILVSIIFLSSESKKEKAIYDEILEKYKDIKEYSETIEHVVDSLDKLIDSFLTRYNSSSVNNVKLSQSIGYRVEDSQTKEKVYYSMNKPDDVIIGSPSDLKNKEEEVYDGYKKENINYTVKMLKQQGLSNHEIAKKLGKGIREVDIITKMLKYKDSNNID